MPVGSASAAASFGHAINHVINGGFRRIYRGVQYSTYDTSFAAVQQSFSSYTFQVVGAASIDTLASVVGNSVTIKGITFTKAAAVVNSTDWTDALTLAEAIRKNFVGELTAGVFGTTIVMVATIPGSWTDTSLALYTLADTLPTSWMDYLNTGALPVAGQLNVVPIQDFEVPTNLAISGATAPAESFVANWYVYGAKAFLTLHPRAGFTGEKVGGLTGPDPIRVTFQETGQLTFEQPFDNYYHLLDRPITLFCYLAADSGSASVKIELDYGGGKISSLTVPTTAYQSGGQLRLNTTIPYDATKFVLRLIVNGSESSSLYIGEVGLYIGTYSSVRFTEDIVEHARPIGECIFYYGFPAPPGFITVCDSDGRLVFHSAGDPKVDGLTASPFGGEEEHNHNKRTNVSDTGDNPKGGGRWALGKNHFHIVDDATMVPLNFRLLMVERV